MRFRENSVRSSEVKIKDPRIHPMTSVMAVEVAPDLKTCKAFISVLGNEEAKDSIRSQGLNKCRGIYQKTACKKSQSEKYTGDTFHS